MIIVECEQLSPEWFATRAGVPSCSNFDKIVTMKGEQSKTRSKYMFQLAGEKITGTKEEGYQNAAMLRGIELEGEARQAYELVTDNTVTEVGFCFADEDRLYGGSPDGLIGDEGCLEIKCPGISVHSEYLYKGVLPSAYFQQVQGQLLVTGCKWVDFVSYYPSMRPFIHRVKRDEKFLAKLRSELESFCKELDEIVRRIR